MFVTFLSYLVKAFRDKLTAMDFIPLTTVDYKLAFCQATGALPGDIQREIWQRSTTTSPPSTPPGAPKKTRPSPRLARLMNGWAQRKL